MLINMANQSGDRRSARSRVMLAGTLEYLGASSDVRVLDMSRHGALLRGKKLPQAETPVTLRCGRQAVSGWVVWATSKRAGLNFDVEVSREEFVRPPAAAKSFVPIPPPQNWRRPSFRGDPLTPDERCFVDRLQSEDQLPLPLAGKRNR